MNSRCLDEEQLISLYYDEADAEAAACREHIRECPACQQAFAALCSELAEIDLPVPDGGHRAVAEALKLIGRQQPGTSRDEIMTLEEVAEWLKVSAHALAGMLHQLPHFIVAGQIRFNRRLLENHLFNRRSEAENKAPDQPRQRLKVVGGRAA